MGINGLLLQLKSVSRPTHVNSYAGKRVAIDGYSWLHKGAYSCSMELCEGRWTDGYVRYFMSRIDMLLACGVEPLVVFDGCRLPMKADEEESRRKPRREALERARAHAAAGNMAAAVDFYQRAVSITPAMAKVVIEALRERRGARWLVAPYEADAQLAALALREDVVAVLTEDSDMLAYGCPRVLFKLDKSGLGEEVVLSDMPLAREINMAGFSHDMLVQMCILAGCDFLPNLPGLGIKKAHLLMRKHRDFVKVVRALRFNGASVPRDYEARFQRTIWLFRHQRVFCPHTRRLEHLRPLPAGGLAAADVLVPGALPADGPEREALPFLGPVLDDAAAAGIADGDLDPSTMQPFDLAAIYAGCPCPPQHLRHLLPQRPAAGGPGGTGHHHHHHQHGGGARRPAAPPPDPKAPSITDFFPRAGAAARPAALPAASAGAPGLAPKPPRPSGGAAGWRGQQGEAAGTGRRASAPTLCSLPGLTPLDPDLVLVAPPGARAEGSCQGRLEEDDDEDGAAAEGRDAAGDGSSAGRSPKRQRTSGPGGGSSCGGSLFGRFSRGAGSQAGGPGAEPAHSQGPLTAGPLLPPRGLRRPSASSSQAASGSMGQGLTAPGLGPDSQPPDTQDGGPGLPSLGSSGGGGRGEGWPCPDGGDVASSMEDSQLTQGGSLAAADGARQPEAALGLLLGRGQRRSAGRLLLEGGLQADADSAMWWMSGDDGGGGGGGALTQRATQGGRPLSALAALDCRRSGAPLEPMPTLSLPSPSLRTRAQPQLRMAASQGAFPVGLGDEAGGLAAGSASGGGLGFGALVGTPGRGALGAAAGRGPDARMALDDDEGDDGEVTSPLRDRVVPHGRRRCRPLGLGSPSLSDALRAAAAGGGAAADGLDLGAALMLSGTSQQQQQPQLEPQPRPHGGGGEWSPFVYDVGLARPRPHPHEHTDLGAMPPASAADGSGRAGAGAADAGPGTSSTAALHRSEAAGRPPPGSLMGEGAEEPPRSRGLGSPAGAQPAPGDNGRADDVSGDGGGGGDDDDDDDVVIVEPPEGAGADLHTIRHVNHFAKMSRAAVKRLEREGGGGSAAGTGTALCPPGSSATGLGAFAYGRAAAGAPAAGQRRPSAFVDAQGHRADAAVDVKGGGAGGRVAPPPAGSSAAWQRQASAEAKLRGPFKVPRVAGAAAGAGGTAQKKGRAGRSAEQTQITDFSKFAYARQQ